ncbi:MAG: zinc ABC transporter substrate-binding protein [Ectothiorhodospiraceae bacterium]|nr:zinc ABC transporter substrate-binding protein [Ectothiorhodospiraceae bacterium]MCH8503407.1 zinc ABC transporter substrate-binding protein [Ectothiorhodospiraceae bacterium]
MRRLWWLLMLLLFMSAAWAVERPVPVAVSVPPQASLVQAIGGDRVSVQSMVSPGQSTHTFAPSPRQLRAMEDAQLYVKVGHPEYRFEHQFMQVLEGRGDRVVVIDSAEGVALRELEGHHHDHGHAHGHRHDHDHGDTDPHLWVSPSIMRNVAVRVAEALAALDPEGEAHYRQGLEDFLGALDTVDAELRDTLSGLQRRTFLVNHPAWGYFADDYDLRQMSIEVDGKEPTPAQLGRFIERARAKEVRLILVQPGFSRRSADVIARELDIDVVEMDPMAEDWLGNLRRMGAVLREALS